MKISKILKFAVAAIGISFLVGCSHHGSNAEVSDADASGSYASGLGERAKFGGHDVEGVTYTTKAPHDQLYYFEFNSNDVKQKYLASIRAQAQYLASHPGARVLIAGHTDERGSSEYNVALGERRANAVAEIMRVAGVSRNQVRVVSYGKERPAALGHDDAAYSLNRRVELTYEATR